MPTHLPSDLSIRELLPGELPLILPLIEAHNPTIPSAELRLRLETMIPRGYHCIAAFAGETITGVAGYWLIHRFYSGEYMDVDNVVVDETLRSRGTGAALMAWLEDHARRLGCQSIMLDSYVSYARAHRFYFRLGYEILGFHFRKVL